MCVFQVKCLQHADVEGYFAVFLAGSLLSACCVGLSLGLGVYAVYLAICIFWLMVSICPCPEVERGKCIEWLSNKQTKIIDEK